MSLLIALDHNDNDTILLSCQHDGSAVRKTSAAFSVGPVDDRVSDGDPVYETEGRLYVVSSTSLADDSHIDADIKQRVVYQHLIQMMSLLSSDDLFVLSSLPLTQMDKVDDVIQTLSKPVTLVSSNFARSFRPIVISRSAAVICQHVTDDKFNVVPGFDIEEIHVLSITSSGTELATVNRAVNIDQARSVAGLSSLLDFKHQMSSECRALLNADIHLSTGMFNKLLLGENIHFRGRVVDLSEITKSSLNVFSAQLIEQLSAFVGKSLLLVHGDNLPLLSLLLPALRVSFPSVQLVNGSAYAVVRGMVKMFRQNKGWLL